MKTPTDTVIARRPAALAAFLLLAFGLPWLALWPVVVDAVSPTSTAGKVFLPLVAIGSPGIAAFVVAGLFGGRAGVFALLGAGARWQVRIRWYAVVVLLPPVVYGLALVAHVGSTGEPPTLDLSVEVWIAAVVSGLLAGTLEEFGWSGMAFPALLERFGLLLAGGVTGVIVALWHVPLFFIPNQPQSTFSFLPFLLTLMVVRTVFGWIYVGTGGSVLACVLFHASGNAWPEVLPVPPPGLNGSWMAETAVFAVVAIAALAQWWRSGDGRPRSDFPRRAIEHVPRDLGQRPNTAERAPLSTAAPRRR